MAIRIITDSAADIALDNKLGIRIIPLSITFGTKEYKDMVDFSHKQFYEKLKASDEIPKTSQPTPYDFEQEFKKTKEAGDIALVICVSKKLSGTYNSAMLAAQKYDGVVYVVDSGNVSLGQNILVQYAKRLVDEGRNIDDIVTELNDKKHEITVLALLDTLEYLKKGGRIPTAVALIAHMISLKPIVGVEKGKLSMLGKARGAKKAKYMLSDIIASAGGVNFNMPYCVGYTGGGEDVLKQYVEDNKAQWEGNTASIPTVSIGATIGTHAGPGAIGVAFFSKNAKMK